MFAINVLVDGLSTHWALTVNVTAKAMIIKDSFFILTSFNIAKLENGNEKIKKKIKKIETP